MKKYLNFYFLLKIYHKIKSRRIKSIGLLLMARFGVRHLSVRIDPSLSCNLRCQMCYFSNKDYRKESKGNLSVTDIENIARIFFPKAMQVVVGCGAEPTINHNFMQIIELAHEHKVPNISIVTNGVLLRQKQIDRMSQLNIEVILSAHGLTKDNYEKFMTNSNYEKFIDLLSYIKSLNIEKKQLKLRMNYTANNENLNDLEQLPHFLDKYSISTVQIRPVMDIGGNYSQPISKTSQAKYNSIIDAISKKCQVTGTTLLANTSDISYESNNEDVDIIENVYTYISPKTISELALGTKINSLHSYKKATNWYKNLLNGLLRKGRSNDQFLKRSLKYKIQ